jgi:hypothetical protein
MLQIRPEQMAEFDKAVRRNFHQRLLAHYRQHLPEVTASWDDATLAQRIADADRRASLHGIRSERGIARFVGIALVAGPEFDNIPEVRACLDRPGVDPEVKIDLLVDCLTELENQKGLSL